MHYFIINPNAQSGKAVEHWEKIRKICHERNIEYRYVYTKYPGQMTEIVHRHTANRNPKHIYVLGGDGSFNEAVNGLQNPDVHTITFLPAGSGNDLARGLGFPGNPSEFFDQLTKNDDYEEKTIDLGAAYFTEKGEPKKHLFAVSSGFGFDADITKGTNRSPLKKILNRIGLGKLTYLIIGIKSLFAWKPQEARLWIDDAQEPIILPKFLFMATHVHPYEGGGFPFCPDAENGDGLIDLCIVNGLGLPRIFPLIPLAKFGKHKGCKGVILTKCKKARIQVDTPVSFHTDGEVHEDQTELTYMSNEYGYRLQVK